MCGWYKRESNKYTSGLVQDLKSRAEDVACQENVSLWGVFQALRERRPNIVKSKEHIRGGIA